VEQENTSYPEEIEPGKRSDNLKLGVAVLVGAAMGLGVYFMVMNNNASPIPNQAAVANQPAGLCVCRNCGTTINRPAGIDCEELNCPNCGHAMMDGMRTAAALGGGATAGRMTQNQRETLAEQRAAAAPAAAPVQRGIGGGPVAGRMTQNQRETLAEQRLTTPPVNRGAVGGPTRPLPAAMTVLPPMGTNGTCICPNCGKTLDRLQGVSCSNATCPVCQSRMTNAILIGRAADTANASLVALNQRGANQPTGGGVVPCPHGGAGGGGHRGAGNQQAGGGPPAAQAPCPPGGGQTGGATISQGVTYTNTARGIVAKNCLGCHGGPIRNLTTYSKLKAYADNGMLLMMTQPGGPMSRFLTAHEYQQFNQWVKAGAPN
jgi:hypothetical protein